MIETNRLRLVPLSYEQLCLFKGNPEGLADNLGVDKIEPYDDPETAPHVEEAIQFWLENTKQHPLNFAWYTNWVIIHKDTSCVIGGIGFSGFPQEDGKTMAGYGLNTKYFGKGYASEALRALIAWGFRFPELKAIMADTPIQNIGSQRVLSNNGFTEISRDLELIHWELYQPMTL
jgi:ribosomal-protein-alanine N-acetyltransferase